MGKIAKFLSHKSVIIHRPISGDGLAILMVGQALLLCQGRENEF
jgi:hypothetical protein